MNQSHSFRRKLVSGSLSALLIRIFTVLSNLAINALIARLLKPEEVGTYFLLVSVVSVTTMLCLIGIHQAIVKIVAESIGRGETARARTAVAKSYVIVGVSSLATALGFYFFGFKFLITYVFHIQLLEELTLIGSLWIVFWSFAILTAEIFRGFHRIHYAVLFTRLAPNALAIGMIALYAAVSHGWALKQFSMLVLIGWVCSVMVSTGMVLHDIHCFDGNATIGVGEIIKLSWPMGITSFVLFSLPQVDLWMVSYFQNSSDVAIYGSAARLFRFSAVPLLIVKAVVPPMIADMYSRNETRELEKALRTAANLSFFPGFFVVAACLVFGDDILRIVYGPYYEQAGLILRILIIGMFARILVGSSDSLLMMTGHERLLMRISILSGLVLIITGFVLGRYFGGTGIAVAVTVSTGLQSVLCLLAAKERTGIWNLPNFAIAKDRAKKAC